MVMIKVSEQEKNMRLSQKPPTISTLCCARCGQTQQPVVVDIYQNQVRYCIFCSTLRDSKGNLTEKVQYYQIDERGVRHSHELTHVDIRKNWRGVYSNSINLSN